jgi:hypothetical protein
MLLLQLLQFGPGSVEVVLHSPCLCFGLVNLGLRSVQVVLHSPCLGLGSGSLAAQPRAVGPGSSGSRLGSCQGSAEGLKLVADIILQRVSVAWCVGLPQDCTQGLARTRAL